MILIRSEFVIWLNKIDFDHLSLSFYHVLLSSLYTLNLQSIISWVLVIIHIYTIFLASLLNFTQPNVAKVAPIATFESNKTWDNKERQRIIGGLDASTTVITDWGHQLPLQICVSPYMHPNSRAPHTQNGSNQTVTLTHPHNQTLRFYLPWDLIQVALHVGPMEIFQSHGR